MTIEEMTAQRDAPLAARFRAIRTVEIDGRRIMYASNTEMAAAIADLEQCIAQGEPPPANSRVCFEGTMRAGFAETV
jgi:hypothetical protein